MLAKTPCGVPPEFAEYARKIEQAINAQWHPPIRAEIASEESVAQWLLLRTVNNEEARARRHLARRRFGVFHPSGVFPAGYLFIYVFDAVKMLERIEACPGVKCVVCAVSDAFVQALLAEYAYQERSVPKTHVGVRSGRYAPKKPKAKTLNKSERKALSKVRKLLKKLGFKDESTLESARKLAIHKRITLLKKTAKALSPAAKAA